MPDKFYRIWNRVRRFLQRLFGIATLGARIIVLNERRQVCLVRHTYADGWYFPGGGVQRGETTMQAAIREAAEEAGVVATQDPEFFAVHYHQVWGADDHVFFYILQSFTLMDAHSPEIAEVKWFDLNQLPPNLSRTTAQYLKQALTKLSPQRKI